MVSTIGKVIFEKNKVGQAFITFCLSILVVLFLGPPVLADSDEKVSAVMITGNDKALTYIADMTEFEKVVNSVETYFSKVGEGEKLVSVEFSHELTAKEVTVPTDAVKTAVEALGVIVRQLKNSDPAITVTVIKDVVKNEEIPYDVEYRNNKTMYEGTEKVKRAGKNGLRYIEGQIIEVNGKESSSEIVLEDVLEEPVTEIIEEGTKPTGKGTGKLIVPTNGGYLSSGFGQRGGRMHKGIDIARPDTYTIVAADTGRVTFTGTDGGYGKKVVIDHGNGMKTVYAHLASVTVKKGQVIEQGKRIGIMGKTGWATGIHLHFEVIVKGSYKNPTNYIKI